MIVYPYFLSFQTLWFFCEKCSFILYQLKSLKSSGNHEENDLLCRAKKDIIKKVMRFSAFKFSLTMLEYTIMEKSWVTIDERTN